MQHHIKLIILVIFFSLNGSVSLAQLILSHDDTLEIEQLNEIISDQIDPEISNLEQLILTKTNSFNMEMDSLRSDYLKQLELLNTLTKRTEALRLELHKAQAEIILNQQMNIEKDRNIQQLFLISGSGILFFILVLLVLFTLLLNRQKKESDQKFNELKVFTQKQILGTRKELIKKIKERVKYVARKNKKRKK